MPCHKYKPMSFINWTQVPSFLCLPGRKSFVCDQAKTSAASGSKEVTNLNRFLWKKQQKANSLFAAWQNASGRWQAATQLTWRGFPTLLSTAGPLASSILQVYNCIAIHWIHESWLSQVYTQWTGCKLHSVNDQESENILLFFAPNLAKPFFPLWSSVSK